MPTALRFLVEARADGRCEYYRRYQELIGSTFFEVDHILPRILDGQTVPGNLAFACCRCNLLKGSKIQAIDLQTDKLARLFHPRQDNWNMHFIRSDDYLRIEGRTTIGRATTLQLRLNDPSEQRTREIQRNYLIEYFPFD